MKKIKTIKSVLEKKTVSYVLLSLILVIAVFISWTLVERHRAGRIARQANYDFARALKQKAIVYAEKDRWKPAILFSLDSMLHQAKAEKYLPMDDIRLPAGLKKLLLDYLIQNPRYSAKDARELQKTVEQKIGLVLDGNIPVNYEIYYSLDLDYYHHCGKYNNAVEAYSAAAKFYKTGSNFLDNLDYKNAVPAFSEAVKIRPRFKEALNQLAWAYYFTGNKGKARKIYKKAKKVDFDFYTHWNSRAWADRGDRQRENRDYPHAARSYRKSIKINRGYRRAWNSLGEMYESLNRFAKAADVYKEAAAAIPASDREWQSKISYNRGREHLGEYRYQKAAVAFKKAVRLYPKLDRAWLALPDACYKGKKINYTGEKWDFHFNHTDLRQVLIFIARQAGENFLIDPGVKGNITCQLEQVNRDKALDIFLKINDCKIHRLGSFYWIGRNRTIDAYLARKEKAGFGEGKKFTGKPLDLSFPGDDIQFVLQMIAAKTGLKIIVDPGINHTIVCGCFKVPRDMVIAVILEANHLAGFRWGNLIRIGKKADIQRMRQSEAGLLELIRPLYQLDPTQVNVKDEKGKTLLFFAAGRGFPALTGYLAANGAAVNARDKWGFTPLHGAATREVAEILVNRGARVNAWSNTGLTPLRAAVYAMRTDVARYLAGRGARSDIFMDAAMGRLEPVKYMTMRDPGAVRRADSDGWYPLHHAAAAGQFEMAAFLIARGADLNALNKKGETALHIAVSRGRKKVAKLLVMNRADGKIRNKYGKTPLGIARSNGDEPLIRLLQRFGEDR